MRSGDVQAPIVGREAEIGRLRDALRAVVGGQGAVALIDGEPGIGKSALLSAALADAPGLGCELLWGTADELSQRFPLRVMLECLRTGCRVADRRLAEITALLRPDGPTGMLAGADPVPATIELMLTLINEWCSAAPVVLVIDDLQWTDGASLLVCQRLVEMVEQLPLLVVGASGPIPQHQALDRLRGAIRKQGGLSIELDPLPEESVTELVTGLIGASPGVQLRRLAGQAAGNPLYVRELIEAVLRENAADVRDGTAELIGTGFSPPSSLTSAVERRLGFLPGDTVGVLRWAALLGHEFAGADLAVVVGRPLTELAGILADAASAGVVTMSGPRLRFRHPLTRRALYEGVPQAVRVALHRQAAQAFAESGAAVERVAEQLLAAPAAADRWAVSWLVDAADALARRAPLVAVELMERAIAHTRYDDPDREALSARLASVLFRLGRTVETKTRARQTVASTRDPDRAAHMRWLLGYVLLREGRQQEALDTIEQALTDRALKPVWAARLQALRSLILANGWGDQRATTEAAELAIELGERAGDRFAVGHALSSMFCVHAAERDYTGGLTVIDRALTVLGDDGQYSDLRTILLEHRAFLLQNLDRLDDADSTLRTVHELGDRGDDALRSRLDVASGIQHYWVGRWDDAYAEFGAAADDLSESSGSGLRAAWPMLLLHGGLALIAAHRDDRAAAAVHLQAGARLGVHQATDQDNCDFLLAAEALAAERDGAPERALAVYAPILDPSFGQTLLRHQWLPDIARLAVELGDADTAGSALRMCEMEAAREAKPARATAALGRCRGIVHDDLASLRSAADHYRSVGRIVELAQTLEDVAVLLARRAEGSEARHALTESVRLYGQLGANWDIRRADTRARRHGVRRGVGGPRRRGADSGWGALTPTELRVARLVAEGRSNPEIAVELLLSRRTVQTHVQHILTKLGAHSRVEIARQATDRPNAQQTG